VNTCEQPEQMNLTFIVTWLNKIFIHDCGRIRTGVISLSCHCNAAVGLVCVQGDAVGGVRSPLGGSGTHCDSVQQPGPRPGQNGARI
jgi:hypothetical protein